MYGCAASVCTLCACSAPDTIGGVQISLGPEMQAVVSQYIGAGNQTGKAPSAPKTWAISPAPSEVDVTLEARRRACVSHAIASFYIKKKKTKTPALISHYLKIN